MDILREINNIVSYDWGFVKNVETGERYVAVMNKDGNIGVCAIIGNEINNINVQQPDLENISDRIFLTAYYNSVFNVANENYKTGDIVENIDFAKYKNIVMIGYFFPIVERLQKLNIEVSVFDLRNQEVTIPMEKQKEYLQGADAVILTATSIFNNTFYEIVSNTKADVFILGPSSILSKFFFNFNNVKAIFGSIFDANDNRILKAVKDGMGTRQFLKYGQKVVLHRGL